MGSFAPPNRVESLKTKIVWSVFKLSFEGVDFWGSSIKPPQKKGGPQKKIQRKSWEILERNGNKSGG